MHKRIEETIKSVIAEGFRRFFSMAYSLRKRSPSIIKTVFFGARQAENIKNALSGNLSDFSDNIPLAKGYGTGMSERVVELPWLLSRIPKGAGRHLDAGSALNYEYLLRHRNIADKDIVILNLNPERNCYWTDEISYLFADYARIFSLTGILTLFRAYQYLNISAWTCLFTLSTSFTRRTIPVTTLRP